MTAPSQPWRQTMITDEMVELGCAAISQKRGYDWPSSWDEEELRIGRENMRAALSAALSVETRAKVKPLEWTAEDNGEFIAVSAVGWYHIGFPARSWNLTMPSGEVPSFGDDLEAAKAAAQADYSARILSALSVEQPTPTLCDSSHTGGENV